MAIYHLTTKAVSRGKGQSIIASAAYRSGEKIKNERTGEISDYQRKLEVDYKNIIGFKGTRSELWNEAEAVEKRKDATLAKEYEISLPRELDREQKIELAEKFGNYLNERHKVAVDICIHKIDSDNPHAHILTTTREVINGNELGEKVAREWSDTRRKQHGMNGRKNELIEARKEWEKLANKALKLAHIEERIDHRSLKAQGTDRDPQIHLGVTASEMEKKGLQTDRGDINRNRLEVIEVQKELAEVQKQKAYEIRFNALPDDLPSIRKLEEKEADKAHEPDAQRAYKALSQLIKQIQYTKKRARRDQRARAYKA